MSEKRPVIAAVVKSFPPAFRSGGPGRSIAGIIDILGDDLDFRVLTSMNDNGHDLAEDGVRSDHWTVRNGAEVYTVATGARAAVNLIRAINEAQPDVLYLNSLFHPVFGVAPLIARRLGLLRVRRTVLAPRGELAPAALGLKSAKKRGYLRLLFAAGLHRGVVWQATSETELDHLRSVVGDRGQLRLAPTLRRLPPPLPRDSQAGTTLRLVLLAKIDRMKNIDGAIEAVAGCHADVHLTIAGPIKDDRYWSECQHLIEQLEVEYRVSHVGAVPPGEISDFLADFDGFVLPTRGENFGHAILEALAAGLPTIISDQTRWTGLRDAGAGWALPLGSPEPFAEAIDALASMDHAARRRMGAAAATIAQDYLSDPEVRQANLWLLDPPRPQVAAVNYTFPVTTQTFHHRRHRVMLESGNLEGIHHVNAADGTIEARSRSIENEARPIRRRDVAAAIVDRSALSHLTTLMHGLRLARRGNGEGGRLGFLWQALNGLALGRELSHGDTDVVHAAFATAPATVALFASLRSQLPLSVEVHSPTSMQRNPALLRFKLDRAALVVAISQYTASRLRPICPDANIDVIHCGLDRPTSGAVHVAPQALGFDILAVGSLIPKKGHDLLIRASARLCEQGVEHTVAIAGEGPMRTELQQLIDRLRAPVTLLGSVPPDELALLRSQVRVGALASIVADAGDEDGIPVALMEFLAFGIPVVASDVAGIAELVSTDALGRLVSPGDSASLAAALSAVLGHTRSDLADDDREHRRRHIEANFDNLTETNKILNQVTTLDHSPIARR